MPSPFPGMDPYLEELTLWPDVHQRLITYISDTFQPTVRPRYHTRRGERLYVVEVPHTILRGCHYREAALAEAEAPYVLTIPPVQYREPFVEIVHAAGGEVVTVIEVLSPANKTAGEGHRLYRQKQGEVLRSQAHLVEIDLLSRGLPTLALPETSLSALLPWRYLVSVSRTRMLSWICR